jgi:hypothetical protein
MATNGSKWQLFGTILAADTPLMGREWPPDWQQMAAEWQLNGNKWQQERKESAARRWRGVSAGD